MRVVVDEFEVDRHPESICTDGVSLYYPDYGARPGWVMRRSLCNDERRDLIPSPPGTDTYDNLSEPNCVSNGQLFMVGYGAGKLFKTKIPPLTNERLDGFRSPHRFIDGVEWKPVADLPVNRYSTVTDIDVIVEGDDELRLVCVGYDDRSRECFVYYFDSDGGGNLKPHPGARLCKFVPSYDELVCVASRSDSHTFSWTISLVDVWSMSVIYTLDYLCRSKYRSFCAYMATTESGLVVLAQQKESFDPLFEVSVWRLSFCS
ncbi:hypothetical protein FOZ63_023942 [Perkinsus olseni]|uniref:Uncharacterized protein n=1 Tax=Perkinsus olseni TaxID=32597 RepID=A0A7J6SU13_PEROL|nr:hypothetical protein FOZ63_023942 [Perkinsus olseni]KAF4736237.1 hypothetical protein FOZ62_009094 [Perkinsus olseni]